MSVMWSLEAMRCVDGLSPATEGCGLTLALFTATVAHAAAVVLTVRDEVTALLPLTVVLGMVKQAFAIDGLAVTTHEIVPV